MEITRTALVLHSAQDMYRLVQDVTSYPAFLSWCSDADVLEQTAELQLARLQVSIGGLTQSFTTRNRLVPGQLLTMSLVEGPFRHLSGEWQFDALAARGSKVSLRLSFDFSSSLLSAAFRRGFTRVADKLVADFCRRADQVHGIPAYGA
jgi:ribosome-associated toxin RatA of RatAB toxin-antitoxin module